MTTQALRTISERDYQALIDALNDIKSESEYWQQQAITLSDRPFNADAIAARLCRASNYLPLVVITFLAGCIAGLLLAKLAALIVAGFVAGVVLAIGLIAGHRP